MNYLNAFISYHYDESRDYMLKLKKFLEEEFNINVICEKTNYKHKGLSDKAITKIIRENYLRISNLVIILVSKNAWRRKHLDWELSASLRKTRSNSRKAVIAILIPNYGPNFLPQNDKTSIRLIKNIKNGYIKFIYWNNLNRNIFLKIINDAIKSSKKINPINNDKLRRKNNMKGIS